MILALCEPGDIVRHNGKEYELRHFTPSYLYAIARPLRNGKWIPAGKDARGNTIYETCVIAALFFDRENYDPVTDDEAIDFLQIKLNL